MTTDGTRSGAGYVDSGAVGGSTVAEPLLLITLLLLPLPLVVVEATVGGTPADSNEGNVGDRADELVAPLLLGGIRVKPVRDCVLWLATRFSRLGALGGTDVVVLILTPAIWEGRSPRPYSHLCEQ